MRILFFLLVLPLSSCVSKPDPAPVIDRSPGRSAEMPISNLSGYTRRDVYIVQRGDTLYGIAQKSGLNINRLAEINNIVAPYALRIGQEIYLQEIAEQHATQQENFSSQPKLFSISQSGEAITANDQLNSQSGESNNGISGSLITVPKGMLLPYSATRDQQDNRPGAAQVEAQTKKNSESYQVANIDPATVSKPGQLIDTQKNSSGISWGWPANGQIISRFSEKSKGVGISGQLKQAVLASASGKVVYSGNGLRGYGNLIIIKHNDNYLSAYGHNSKNFVLEGDSVAKGQKIAEMGNNDGGTVKLHFEIREKGKPVDPLDYLPNR
ncbi:peptidoglycan DD-metalloendopeptidase family protein [Nitrosomonas sp.]|uniref:peptidoglycan DD-metalloendopeptidase family protein n=1 Tax=Nitrosomonas sp. TaxID=42353 RepID=UPI0025D42EBC|nr:peptidoglycan DD-metalloendopeptidase family protein [Nitrosomonas sp.]